MAYLTRNVAVGSFIMLVLPVALSSPRRRDTEQDLLGRIQREQSPVKRAKYQIRLARLKLLQAIEAYDKNGLEQCQGLLEAYLEQVGTAWKTLQDTGRQASRKPQGFKELEIELREDARRLEDFQHRVPYADRGAVEKATREVERIHAEVISALFPPHAPTKSKKQDGSSARVDPPTRLVSGLFT